MVAHQRAEPPESAKPTRGVPGRLERFAREGGSPVFPLDGPGGGGLRVRLDPASVHRLGSAAGNRAVQELLRPAGPGVTAQRVPWTPNHADERTAAGTDRFADRTFEVSVPSLSGLLGRLSVETIPVSIFVPSGVVPGRNKVHVFFAPNDTTQTGLPPELVGANAVNTHGMRGASDRSEWILVSVPGHSGLEREDGGFRTLSAPTIARCLTAAGRPTSGIDALRMSCHSRGYRGLVETLNRRLIPAPRPERVMIFDAAYASVGGALRRRGVPGRSVVTYNVVEPDRTGLRGARSVSLPIPAMRAIGYTRVILDARVTEPTLRVPPAIAGQLLPLPPRGSFTSLRPVPAGKTSIVQFARTHAAEINRIETGLRDPARSLKDFMDGHNLTRMNTVFSRGIDAHHLFVAELAHEAVE